MSFTFDESQFAAIDLCCNDALRIVGVSGCAGTGKTSIMQEVNNRLSTKGWDCALVAPTGKTARRITQVSGIPARTLHKLLEFPRPGDVDEQTGKPLTVGYPARNRTHRLEYNCILIDEAPMVSAEMIRYLYEALPNGGIVRMFGDLNQLPPVDDKGETSPFKKALYETMPNGMIKTKGIILNTIHRQGEGSGIVSNGAKIIEGRYPNKTDDFHLHPTVNHINTLLKLLPNADYASINNQIIVPGNKFDLGTYALNNFLRTKLNPNCQSEMLVERHTWHADNLVKIGVGDKVVMGKNWYDLGKEGVLNGETGVVVEITSWKEIVIDFGEEVVSIPTEVSYEFKGVERFTNPQKDLDLAYAVTTHKAQGSEYDHVIYILGSCHRAIMDRHNTYTAVTRAKKRVDLIYEQKCMSRALAPMSLASAKKTTKK